MAVLLLLAAAVCAFAAAIANSDWGWMSIDYNPQAYRMWVALSLLFFVLSFLPWAWLRRFDRR